VAVGGGLEGAEGTLTEPMPTRVTVTVDPERARSEALTEAGQRIVIDADPPHGDDSAPSPKEALLAALAACTAIDVASILRKKQQRPTRYEIVVSGDSAEEHPKVFTAITVEHRFAGDVEPEAARRSVELSATRYCPVSAMLSASATLTHRYRVTLADGSEAAGVVAVTGPDGIAVMAPAS
jgi:putative redox protein